MCYAGSKSALPLDLNRRLQIALDATRGLAYLHGTNPGVLIIVHRNVTSRHILLDNNLNAKLAGFAMARLMPDDCDAILETHIDGTPVSSLRIQFFDCQILFSNEISKYDYFSLNIRV